jgi:hypothetical protein
MLKLGDGGRDAVKKSERESDDGTGLGVVRVSSLLGKGIPPVR